jgi:hypothetical protein
VDREVPTDMQSDDPVARSERRAELLKMLDEAAPKPTERRFADLKLEGASREELAAVLGAGNQAVAEQRKLVNRTWHRIYVRLEPVARGQATAQKRSGRSKSL